LKRSAWIYSNSYIFHPTKFTIGFSFPSWCRRMGAPLNKIYFIHYLSSTNLDLIRSHICYEVGDKSFYWGYGWRYTALSVSGILRFVHPLLFYSEQNVSENENICVTRWGGHIELWLTKGAAGGRMN
jgi:hypothetical protein